MEYLINELLMDTYSEIYKVEQATLACTRLKDLSITEIHTIHAIGRTRCSMGEVAGRLGVAMATLTVAIDKLQRKGYVLRMRSEEDRRMVFIELTHNGIAAFRIHNIYHLRMMSDILRDMDEGEKETFRAVLERINQYFRKGATELDSRLRNRP